MELSELPPAPASRRKSISFLPSHRTRVNRRRICSWSSTRILLHYLLSLLGIYYILTHLIPFLVAVSPEKSTLIADKWHGYTPSHDQVLPVACHSHNDYWRPEPLLTALEFGCTAVEADVWLAADGQLLIGHTAHSLSPDRTLSSLYINPLLDILGQANAQDNVTLAQSSPLDGSLRGVFETDFAQSLVLLIDFKTDGLALWPRVNEALEPFRQKDYLTRVANGEVLQRPITLVVSGNAPFGRVFANPSHDILFDAPLQAMSSWDPQPTNTTDEPEPAIPRVTVAVVEESPLVTLDLSSPNTYNWTNSYYASVSYMSSIGYPIHSKLSSAQLSLLRAQIHGAHIQGLKVRYWGIPAWPIGVRNYLWRVMVREGVDYLSVDDVRALVKDNWGPRKGGW